MRICLLLGLLFCCSTVFAELPETPQFRHVTVADGLPSSTIYDITQDKKGYIWIASKDGLARYDGVDYKIYRYSPNDNNSLPGNVVQVLHVDNEDRLWIAIEGQGISRLNAERTHFTHFRKSSHPEMGSDDIWAMTSDKNGNLWFGTYGGGLHRMDKSGRIIRLTTNRNNTDSLPSDTILSLTRDEKDRMWVGTTKGLCLWDRGKIKRIEMEDSDTYIAKLIIDRKDSNIWAGTSKGLMHISKEGKQIGKKILSGKLITGLWQDKRGAIWFSDRQNIFQLVNHRLTSYTPDTAMPAEIYGVFEDHEGGLWFPTFDRGLLQLSYGWRNFSIFEKNSDKDTFLLNNIVRAFSEKDPENIWLVSYGGGLDKINLISGRIDRVLSGTEKLAQRTWSVLQTRDGAIWIGHTNGMTKFNPRTKEIKNFLSGDDKQATLHGAVRLLVQTPDGLLWSVSYGAGIQARDETGRIVHTILPSDEYGFIFSDPDQLIVTPEGKLWIATTGGLLEWNERNEKFLHIEGSPRERIDAFSFTGAHTVWTHTVGALEAFRWNGKKLKSFKKISAKDGLPNVEAGAMLPDRNGNLWLTTTRGLLRFGISTNQIRIYGERDGLPSQEFDMQPALINSKGFILTSTNKGLVVFNPKNMRDSSVRSPLVLDEVSVSRGDKSVHFSLSALSIELLPYDRDLTVRARLLSFADSSTHRYRFLIRGYDRDWVDTGALGERVLSSLPYGNYQMEIKAADAEGNWSGPLKIKLVVLPPWWKTGWAIGLWITLLSAALIGLACLYRNRLNLLNEQRLKDQEREIAQQNSSAKSRFLATLGHEIRTPMTGVLGMAELLQSSQLDIQQRHRVNSIQTAGQHLLRLVNDVLDLSQIEAGKLYLHHESFNVHSLINEMSDFLKPLAESKGLGFDCVIDESTPVSCHGDAGRLRQILLNLGTNAIKFTEEGRVSICSGGLAPHGLRLQVRDTGPGMSEEQQLRLFQRFEQAEGNRTNQRYGGSGLGLAICQELATAMDGHITVESSLGKGAVFIVELPLPTKLEISEDIANSESVAGNIEFNILLVEDDLLVAEVLTGLLTGLGHHPSHAQQGLQALSMLATGKYDIALLDLDLPGIGGLELARLIQAQGHSISLIGITARADDLAETAVMAAGMKAFIRKPVSAANLQNILQMLASNPVSV